MSIADKVYEIIDKYDKTGEVDECVGEIKNYLSEKLKPNNFLVMADMDVFDSCGLDIYYVMAAWNDADGLHLCGNRITSC